MAKASVEERAKDILGRRWEFASEDEREQIRMEIRAKDAAEEKKRASHREIKPCYMIWKIGTEED